MTQVDYVIILFAVLACGCGIGYFVGRKSGVGEGYDKAHLELHDEIEKRLKKHSDE